MTGHNPEIDDGGSAFPSRFVGDGMSLRDWFATHCPEREIKTFTLADQLDRFGQDAHSLPVDEQESILRCEARFKYADRMIKARGAK